MPEPQQYAVGMLFLPQKINQAKHCIDIFEKEIERQGLSILGWRDVPLNSKIVGSIAATTQPIIKQVFVGKNNIELTESEFSTKLFVARKISENEIYNTALSQKQYLAFITEH